MRAFSKNHWRSFPSITQNNFWLCPVVTTYASKWTFYIIERLKSSVVVPVIIRILTNDNKKKGKQWGTNFAEFLKLLRIANSEAEFLQRCRKFTVLNDKVKIRWYSGLINGNQSTWRNKNSMSLCLTGDIQTILSDRSETFGSFLAIL